MQKLADNKRKMQAIEVECQKDVDSITRMFEGKMSAQEFRRECTETDK